MQTLRRAVGISFLNFQIRRLTFRLELRPRPGPTPGEGAEGRSAPSGGPAPGFFLRISPAGGGRREPPQAQGNRPSESRAPPTPPFPESPVPFREGEPSARVPSPPPPSGKGRSRGRRVPRPGPGVAAVFPAGACARARGEVRAPRQAGLTPRRRKESGAERVPEHHRKK